MLKLYPYCSVHCISRDDDNPARHAHFISGYVLSENATTLTGLLSRASLRSCTLTLPNQLDHLDALKPCKAAPFLHPDQDEKLCAVMCLPQASALQTSIPFIAQ